MYYIMNETKHIIAADESLLKLCGVSNINEFTSNISLNKLSLETISQTQINITTNIETHTFPISYTSLSSLLGMLTLVTLDTSYQSSQNTSNNTIEEIIDIDSLIIKSKSPNEPTIINNITKETTPDIATESTASMPLELLLDNNEETPKDIVIDISRVSKDIGISEKDFSLFLNEYIDTALDLEEDLKSEDKDKCSSAVHTLKHLSEVLHLDEAHQILQDIEKSTPTTKIVKVASFYDTLSRITTKNDPVSPQKTTHIEEVESLVLLDLLEDDSEQETETKTEIETNYNTPITIPDIKLQTTPVIEKEPVVKAVKSTGNTETINLSSIVPIPFDFQVSTAAEQLSLPENLIEEFMLDFIEQAHTETDNMILAYQTGDLDTVQKIGHLLKGVSSNLRISMLPDTLYQIQFAKELDEIPALIKTYWAHFLFFEKQIKKLSN